MNIKIKLVLGMGIVFLIEFFVVSAIFASFLNVQKIDEIEKRRTEIARSSKQLKERVVYEIENIHRTAEFSAWNYGVVTEYESHEKSNSNIKRVKFKIMAGNIRHWLENLKIPGIDVGIADTKDKIIVYSASDRGKSSPYLIGKITSSGETRDFIEETGETMFIASAADINNTGRLIVKKSMNRFLDESKEILQQELIFMKNNEYINTTIFKNEKRLERIKKIKDIYLKDSGVLTHYQTEKGTYEFWMMSIYDGYKIGSGYLIDDIHSKYSIFQNKYIVMIGIISMISSILIVLIFHTVFIKLFK